MKLKINNKLLILQRKKLHYCLLLNLYGLLLCIFLYIMLWLHLLYIIIIYLYDQYG